MGSGVDAPTGISLPLGVSSGCPTSSQSPAPGRANSMDALAALRSTPGSAMTAGGTRSSARTSSDCRPVGRSVAPAGTTLSTNSAGGSAITATGACVPPPSADADTSIVAPGATGPTCHTRTARGDVPVSADTATPGGGARLTWAPEAGCTCPEPSTVHTWTVKSTEPPESVTWEAPSWRMFPTGLLGSMTFFRPVRDAAAPAIAAAAAATARAFATVVQGRDAGPTPEQPCHWKVIESSRARASSCSAVSLVMSPWAVDAAPAWTTTSESPRKA